MYKEYENMNAQRKQFVRAKNKLAQQMDHLSISDKHYDKKYQDMQERMDALYDEIDKIEESMNELEQRMLNIKRQKVSADNVYQFLLFFDKLYKSLQTLRKSSF